MKDQEILEIKKARAEITRASQYRDLDLIWWDTIGVAAEALDRLTPKKPIVETDDFDDRSVCCPHCIGPVTNYWAPGTKPKHCQFCGQALDWGEGAEG